MRTLCARETINGEKGFRQISADANFSIHQSGSRTFLPQSGPDVKGQAGSCSETAEPVSAHSVASSLCDHLHADTTYNHAVAREPFKVELSPPVTFWKKSSQNIVKMIVFLSLQVWLEPTKPVVKQVRSKRAETLAQY